MQYSYFLLNDPILNRNLLKSDWDLIVLFERPLEFKILRRQETVPPMARKITTNLTADFVYKEAVPIYAQIYHGLPTGHLDLPDNIVWPSSRPDEEWIEFANAFRP